MHKSSDTSREARRILDFHLYHILVRLYCVLLTIVRSRSSHVSLALLYSMNTYAYCASRLQQNKKEMSSQYGKNRKSQFMGDTNLKVSRIRISQDYLELSIKVLLIGRLNGTPTVNFLIFGLILNLQRSSFFFFFNYMLSASD
uniref:Uncharacterized protein n=1 Tax=Glossina palpalis gambiensis TaxID=67801 RepID=A0A1B0AW49_9MUSC